MFFSLVPDMKFERYVDVTPEFLASEGVFALLLDIDNTLAPYEQSEPDDEHFGWLKKLTDAGISCALISNNCSERVFRFAEKLGIPAYANSGKPATKCLREALREMSIDRSRAALLGDQIFTDCLAARRLGIKAYIVPPIKDKKSFFVRLKRFFERPYIRRCKVNSKGGAKCSDGTQS